MQALFDFSSSTAPAWGKPSGLSELHVDGFDTEQIWGQLEASCGPALKQLRKKLKLLSSDFALLDEETEAALDGKQISLPLLIVQSRQLALLLVTDLFGSKSACRQPLLFS